MSNHGALIKNADIDHQVSRYRKIYEEFSHITFEIKEDEYKALSKLTKSYKAARKKSDFDKDVWAEYAKKEGFFNDDKAVFIFGFLVTEWKSSMHIAVTKEDADNLLLQVINRAKTTAH